MLIGTCLKSLTLSLQYGGYRITGMVLVFFCSLKIHFFYCLPLVGYNLIQGLPN